jgi:hypothetical protein
MRFVSTALVMMAMALMLLALMLLAPPAHANRMTFVANPADANESPPNNGTYLILFECQRRYISAAGSIRPNGGRLLSSPVRSLARQWAGL